MKEWIQNLLISTIKEKLPIWWKYYKPSIFDRYILRQFITVTFFSLIGIVILYEIIQVFQFLRFYPEGTRGWDIFIMNLHEGVYWAMIFLPLSFTLGAVVVFTRLANHHELRAMVTTGISLRRVMLYPLLFTAIFALFTIGILQEHVIFPLYQKYFWYKKLVFEKVPLHDIDRFKNNDNVVVYGPNHTLYMGDRYLAIAKKLENVVILSLIPETRGALFGVEQTISNEYLISNRDIIEQQRSLDVLERINFSMRIDAESMVWDKDHWILYNGTIWSIDTKTSSIQVEQFTQLTTNILTIQPYYLEKIWYDTTAMRPSQLQAMIKLKRQSGQFAADLEAIFYSNIAYMMNAFFLVLLIVGFIDISKKKISLIENLVVCFVSFGLSYVIFAMGASFAGNGDLPPILGGFLAIFLLAGISIFFYRRLPT